ncbi:hypothetical protein TH2_170 [Shewanella phage Thanatos-2]|nr:hypothetical protein TH2_170 [Shewanella phage Thanatos-2]
MVQKFKDVTAIKAEKKFEVDSFISLLLDSFTAFKVMHLESKTYSEHKALDEFFNGIIPLTDTLSEQWIGFSGDFTYRKPNIPFKSDLYLDLIIVNSAKIYPNVPPSCRAVLDEIEGLALKVKYLLTLK